MSDKITKTARLQDLNPLLAGQRISASIGEVMERVPAHTIAWAGRAE